MTGLRILAVAALLALGVSLTARADSSACVIGGDQGLCQTTVEALAPADTQLADTWFQPAYVHQRAMGCVQKPCTFAGRDYQCTYYYTSKMSQCSMCCTLEGQTRTK